MIRPGVTNQKRHFAGLGMSKMAREVETESRARRRPGSGCELAIFLPPTDRPDVSRLTSYRANFLDHRQGGESQSTIAIPRLEERGA